MKWRRTRKADKKKGAEPSHGTKAPESASQLVHRTPKTKEPEERAESTFDQPWQGCPVQLWWVRNSCCANSVVQRMVACDSIRQAIIEHDNLDDIPVCDDVTGAMHTTRPFHLLCDIMVRMEHAFCNEKTVTWLEPTEILKMFDIFSTF